VDSPRHTVLVVDDDSSIRFLCRVNLELDGWMVREAGTLNQARTELGADDVAVVLLDVHVGNESGVDFLKELRADHPDVRVALLTGSVGSPSLADVHADAVISKPFTLAELAATLQDISPRASRPAG
jgi:two-component system OmpR family response regulator